MLVYIHYFHPFSLGGMNYFWVNHVETLQTRQTHVLSVATTLIALDLRVLTDEEHLATETGAERRPGRGRRGKTQGPCAKREVPVIIR